MIRIEEAATRNLLLSRFDKAVRAEILRQAEIVPLPISERLIEEESAPQHVYFPVTGVLSMLRVFLNGTSVEVGMIGCEGFLGIHAVLGAMTQPNAALVQHGGEAVRVRSSIFIENFHRYESVRTVVFPYIHYFLSQVAQIAACNRLHSPYERLARWLLTMHDRAEGDELIITQEFLAHMLATRRPTINAAVSELRGSGAITTRRNRVTIVDRTALEDHACECYFAVLAEGERVLNFRPPIRSNGANEDRTRFASAVLRSDATTTAFRAAGRRS